MANALKGLFRDQAAAIREGLGDVGKMSPADFPARTREIVALIGSGSSEDVHYVTFMSYDGSEELGKKAVADGDDCADPIARGVFDSPTKESTAQYNYFHIGWADTANSTIGTYSANALKAVKEDRTVYAAFRAETRRYTISYYDGDTLLKSESLAYGAMPSYTPTKDGYSFNGWQPEIAMVTGEATYTAKWTEKVTFATGSWESIASVCDNGQAAECFAVGDTRTEQITHTDGTTESVTFIIADINKCILESGKNAGLVVVTKHALSKKRQIDSKYGAQYYSSTIDTWLNGDLFNSLPNGLQSAIKTRTKIQNGMNVDTTSRKCWLLHYTEVSGTTASYDAIPNFSLFKDANSRIRTLGANGSATKWWLRDWWNSGNTANYSYVGTNGIVVRCGNSSGTAANDSYGIVFGFCI